MSLKRILGMMLASRMAGRGHRRSFGSTAMMGGLGYPRRRSGLGGKLGVAALGYMAYRAYQDHQSRSSTAAGTAGSGTSGSGHTSSASSGGMSSGGLGDMIRDVADRLTGGSSSQQSGPTASSPAPGSATAPAAATGAAAASPEMDEGARAAEELSDDTALLLIRAMITAAYADGALSQEERQNIIGQIDEAGGTPDDRLTMEREIADPKPLETLLSEVNDPETAQEFYLASRAAIDPETERNRAYLADLRQRLGLSDEEVAEVEEMTA